MGKSGDNNGWVSNAYSNDGVSYREEFCPSGYSFTEVGLREVLSRVLTAVHRHRACIESRDLFQGDHAPGQMKSLNFPVGTGWTNKKLKALNMARSTELSHESVRGVGSGEVSIPPVRGPGV